MKIAKTLNLSGLLLVALVVTACGGLTRSDKPAISSWWLKPYEIGTQAPAPEPVTRVAVSVRVAPGLDTDWILTLSSEAKLSHYTGARWVDNLPELVASLTSRTLGASGRFDVVSRRAGGGREDCELQLEVQEFFASIEASGQTTGVRVAISGQYQCESAEPVPVQLNASIPVNDKRMNSIVAAFQQATDRVMKDLLDELL